MAKVMTHCVPTAIFWMLVVDGDTASNTLVKIIDSRDTRGLKWHVEDMNPSVLLQDVSYWAMQRTVTKAQSRALSLREPFGLKLYVLALPYVNRWVLRLPLLFGKIYELQQ